MWLEGGQLGTKTEYLSQYRIGNFFFGGKVDVVIFYVTSWDLGFRRE